MGAIRGDLHAMAFLNRAIDYRAAADKLLALNQGGESEKCRPGADEPTYFLYFHTADLALKAFLRSHDVAIVGTDYGPTHELMKLYEHCKALGLRVGRDDRIDIRNVVDLLQSGNKSSGFRY